MKLTPIDKAPKKSVFRHSEVPEGEAVWDEKEEYLYVCTDDGWVLFDGKYATEFGQGHTWQGRRVRITEIKFEEA